MYKVEFKKRELTENEKIFDLCSRLDLPITVEIQFDLAYFYYKYLFFNKLHILTLNKDTSTIICENGLNKSLLEKLKSKGFFVELAQILKWTLTVFEND